MHQSVLLKEAIEALALFPTGIFVDATFGRGGHSQAIIKNLNEQGRLIALDKDPEAIQYAKLHFKDKRFSVFHSAFSQLEEVLTQYDLSGKVDGVLLDLGVSSPQLDAAERGFSFQQDGPLDMRMNPEIGLSASQWLMQASEQEIADTLFYLGEERFSRRIAKAIIEAQAVHPIETTSALVEIIKKAQPIRDRHKHPATRTFQALRLRVNQELEELEQVLPQIVNILKPGGRMAVISFHSLEDRIVKQFMKKNGRFSEENPHPALQLIAKIKPSREETQSNPRSRSALLRVAEKRIC